MPGDRIVRPAAKAVTGRLLKDLLLSRRVRPGVTVVFMKLTCS